MGNGRRPGHLTRERQSFSFRFLLARRRLFGRVFDTRDVDRRDLPYVDVRHFPFLLFGGCALPKGRTESAAAAPLFMTSVRKTNRRHVGRRSSSATCPSHSSVFSFSLVHAPRKCALARTRKTIYFRDAASAEFINQPRPSVGQEGDDTDTFGIIFRAKKGFFSRAAINVPMIEHGKNAGVRIRRGRIKAQRMFQVKMAKKSSQAAGPSTDLTLHLGSILLALNRPPFRQSSLPLFAAEKRVPRRSENVPENRFPFVLSFRIKRAKRVRSESEKKRDGAGNFARQPVRRLYTQKAHTN